MDDERIHRSWIRAEINASWTEAIGRDARHLEVSDADSTLSLPFFPKANQS